MDLQTAQQEVRLPAEPSRGLAGRLALDRASSAAALTFGVEEELLLLDPASGQVVPAAPALLRRLGDARWAKSELMRFQFEAVTDVCTGLGQLRAQLAANREAAARAAERVGCLLVASGTAPYGTPELAYLTPSTRYRELARRYPAMVAGPGGTCGCHVHVGVPDRDLGVHVLNRLRPWLPPLLALSANSPFADGRDTGWASWRYRLQVLWPTSRPPVACASAAEYDAIVKGLIRCGAVLDARNVYFLARLSPRYPTVEVRIADICLDIDDAVLLAGLVRALVATAIQEVERGAPVHAASARRIEAAARAAAHHGLAGLGLDPWSGATVAQRTLLDRLLNHVHDALERSGDDQEVAALLRHLDARGTGAARQRAMLARAASSGGLAGALAHATLAGCADLACPR
jgi:carboxylate-amine ligase